MTQVETPAASSVPVSGETKPWPERSLSAIHLTVPADGDLSASLDFERLGVVMHPDLSDPLEEWGVLNPAIVRDRNGDLLMFPRIVAKENLSRVSRVRIIEGADGTPVGIERQGLALEPEELWEKNNRTSGIEDPRIVFIAALDRWVMSYAAYGPFGAKVSLAVSSDLLSWERLGPVDFAWEPGVGSDLGLYRNKDAVFFPEPVPGPDGRMSLAMIHRPMWDIGDVVPGEGSQPPVGIADERPGIWISFVALDDVLGDIRKLRLLSQHSAIAFPAHDWESLKIGGGTAPVRVDGGWLMFHHGVVGRLIPGTDHQPHVRYAAGAMLLDATDVTRVLARSSQPLFEPETPEETSGIVPNVVFPTGVDAGSGDIIVYYGMGDSRIGAGRVTLR